jgi:hypothetical protein
VPIVLEHGCFVYAALFLPMAAAAGARGGGGGGGGGLESRADAHRLATAAFDGLIRIWKLSGGSTAARTGNAPRAAAARGAIVERTLARHAAPLNCLALSLDGCRLASADSGGALHVWSVDGQDGGALAAGRRQSAVESAASARLGSGLLDESQQRCAQGCRWLRRAALRCGWLRCDGMGCAALRLAALRWDGMCCDAVGCAAMGWDVLRCETMRCEDQGERGRA